MTHRPPPHVFAASDVLTKSSTLELFYARLSTAAPVIMSALQAEEDTRSLRQQSPALDGAFSCPHKLLKHRNCTQALARQSYASWRRMMKVKPLEPC